MITRTRTVVERIGELLGPIDWSFDFFAESTFYNCSRPEVRQRYIQEHVDHLREAERRHGAGERIEVLVSDYWKELIDIGMYDGWPYWKPYPSVLTSGVLGPEWHPWRYVNGVRPATKDARSIGAE